MWFSALLNTLPARLRQARQAAPRSAPSSRRFLLEQLEDRCQPSTFTADHFVVWAPTAATAGEDFTVGAIIAESASGAVIPDYAGTVTIGSTDPQALQFTYTFSAADNGISPSLILPREWRTAGPQVLEVWDGAGKGTAPVQVLPGPAVALGLAGPGIVNAGTPATYYVEALDAWGNPSPSGPIYGSTIDFASSDPQAILPFDDVLLTTPDGRQPVSIELETVGPQVLEIVNAQAVGEARDGFEVQVLPSKIDQTISFAPLPGPTYGDAPFAVSATSRSGLPVSFAILSGPAALSGNEITLSGAGTVVVEASQGGDDFYNAAPVVDQSFTVAPAPLTVKVNDQTVIVGAVPSFSVTYSGFVLGEGSGALSGALSYSGAGTQPGDYTITANGLNSPNYAINYQSGTLTITEGIALAFDNTRAVNSGATLPIELRLTDALGNNLSSAAAIVHADYLVRVGDPNQAHLPVQAPGSSQPGNNFTYANGLEQFNLKTSKDMAAGTYELFFSIAGDPVEYVLTFVVR